MLRRKALRLYRNRRGEKLSPIVHKVESSGIIKYVETQGLASVQEDYIK